MTMFERWYIGRYCQRDADAIHMADCEAAWNAALTQINTPEIKDFLLAVENEALHQRMRWGSEHDAGKTDQDWFWLIGYLAQKPLYPGCTLDKSLHHMVTTAAACLNWHAHKMGVFTMMRPGIVPPAPTFEGERK